MIPYITNNRGRSIYFKSEGTQFGFDNDGVYELWAGRDLYVRVDGVATDKYSDHVFRIPNYGTVTVEADGGIDLDYYYLSGPVRLSSDYGWIKRSVIFDLDEDDKSWDLLFERAKIIGRDTYW